MKADVLIVGGGPAGTAAALTLRRYSPLSVLVIERGDYSAPRIGEAIGPGVRPLLAYLGVEELFDACGHRRAYSTAAAWGEDQVSTLDFLFTGRGDGWHLDRNRFDYTMANAAKDAGAAVLRNARITDVCRDNESWQIRALRGTSERIEIEARFLIEAGGRSSAIGRNLGAVTEQSDRLIGVIGFVDFDPPWSEPNTILVEAVPDGWWYSAPLPDNRLTVAFMSDADLIQRLAANDLSGWIGLLARAQHTRERVVYGRRPTELIIRRANSQVLKPVGGDGWLACGQRR